MRAKIEKLILYKANRESSRGRPVSVEKTQDYSYVRKPMIVRVNKQTIHCGELFLGAEHIYLDDDWKIPIREIKNFLIIFQR